VAFDTQTGKLGMDQLRAALLGAGAQEAVENLAAHHSHIIVGAGHAAGNINVGLLAGG
jgi:hypothetical protein